MRSIGRLVTWVLGAILVLGAPPPAFTAEAISCLDAAKRTGPGASEYCAPFHFTNDEAFQAIQKLGFKKIGTDYYLVTGEPFPPDLVWQALAVGVSAIQTLYGSNADVYVIRPPATRGEELQIRFGEVPERLLIGRARYAWPAPDGLRPPGADHFSRFYILIVY